MSWASTSRCGAGSVVANSRCMCSRDAAMRRPSNTPSAVAGRVGVGRWWAPCSPVSGSIQWPGSVTLCVVSMRCTTMPRSRSALRMVRSIATACSSWCASHTAIKQAPGNCAAVRLQVLGKRWACSSSMVTGQRMAARMRDVQRMVRGAEHEHDQVVGGDESEQMREGGEQFGRGGEAQFRCGHGVLRS